MTSCEQYRDRMIEYVQGELQPLLHARFESHLSNCRGCTDLHHSVSEGLSRARAYEPTIDPAHLERLQKRLTPYIQRATPERTPILMGLSFAAAAAAVLLLVVTMSQRSPAPARSKPASTAPQSPVVAQDVPKEEPASPAIEKESRPVQRSKLKRARVLASGDFRGKMADDRIELEDGFVVLRVDPSTEPVRVEMPNGSIAAQGSVFVEVVEGGLTTVGTMAGSARVSTPRVKETLLEGQTRTYGADGSQVENPGSARASAYVDDAFLSPAPEVARVEEPAPKKHRSAERRRHRSRSSLRRAKRLLAKAKTREESDLLELFSHAENLARAGRVSEAIDLYGGVLKDQRPAYAPYKGLVRYEIARLRGFALGEVQAAREELLRLKSLGDGEVSTQAAFALCELELENDRCAAKSCLIEIEESAARGVKTEARTLLSRWGLEDTTCGE